MDNYKVLGLSKDCSLDDIIKSYRKLAMKHHPDRGGDIEIFKKVKRAYEELLDSHDEEDEVEQDEVYKSSFSDDAYEQQKKNWTSWKDIKKEVNDWFNKTKWDDIEESSQFYKKPSEKQKPKQENNQQYSSSKNVLTLREVMMGGEYVFTPYGYKPNKIKIEPLSNPNKLVVCGYFLSDAQYATNQQKAVSVNITVTPYNGFTFKEDCLIYTHSISYLDVLKRKKILVPDLCSNSVFNIKIPSKYKSFDYIEIPNAGFKLPNGKRCPILVQLDFEIPDESI